MDNYQKTTGKKYDEKPARRCNSCKRIFAVTKDQLAKGSFRCVFCGSKETKTYQRTTANLPSSADK